MKNGNAGKRRRAETRIMVEFPPGLDRAKKRKLLRLFHCATVVVLDLSPRAKDKVV